MREIENILSSTVSIDKMNKLLESYGQLQEAYDKLDGYTINSKIEKIKAGLNINEELSSSIFDKCSGGEKTRILIAKMLLEEPEVLLLDEPTNNLDAKSTKWLENFLLNYENTVIVVSHDRYFLNKVCTHIADIDYGKIQLFVGNYDFWYESSRLIQRQMKEANKKKEDRIKELQDNLDISRKLYVEANDNLTRLNQDILCLMEANL